MAKIKQKAKREADSAFSTSSTAARKRGCPTAEQSSLTSKEGSLASTAILVEGTPEASKAPHRAFLWLASGSVLIALSNNGTDECQLNRAVLERSSPWFVSQMMCHNPQKTTSTILATPSRYYFALVARSGQSIPYLLKQISESEWLKYEKIGRIDAATPSAPEAHSARNKSQRLAEALVDFKDACALPMNVKGAPQTAQKGIAISTTSQGQRSDKNLKQEPSGLPSSVKEELTTGNKILDGNSKDDKSELYECEKTETSQVANNDIVTDRGGTSVPQEYARNDCDDQERRNASGNYVRAHKDLFRMYYNQLPKICSSDIDQALGECERLITISKYYGSLAIVQPYLSNHLTQYRRPLFIAIASDPPRWLKLSVDLESPLIFSESLIHCAGAWPNSPWPTTLTESTITSLIRCKGEALARDRAQVDMELLVNSLTGGHGDPVTFDSDPESWMMVQFWRDWLTRQMYSQRKVDKEHHATHYRLIRKGGDAYLPKEALCEAISDMWGNGMGTWSAAAEDMGTLKEFAQELVASLTENKLMIDPEAFGIPYLTCIDVTPADYLWLSSEAATGG